MNEGIRLSLKGLSDCATADPLKLRQLLRDFKYPASDEARARIVYYREARDAVTEYHRSGLEPEWLLEMADRLDAKAALAVGRQRTRLGHNARALRSYRMHFADRRLDEVLPVRRLALMHAGVRVSIVPDLRVRERGREKLVKLEFGVEPVGEIEGKVMAQAIIEASRASGLDLPARSALVFDVGRAREICGPRAGTRTKRLIQATCRNVAEIWGSI